MAAVLLLALGTLSFFSLARQRSISRHKRKPATASKSAGAWSGPAGVLLLLLLAAELMRVHERCVCVPAWSVVRRLGMCRCDAAWLHVEVE